MIAVTTEMQYALPLLSAQLNLPCIMMVWWALDSPEDASKQGYADSEARLCETKALILVRRRTERCTPTRVPVQIFVLLSHKDKRLVCGYMNEQRRITCHMRQITLKMWRITLFGISQH